MLPVAKELILSRVVVYIKCVMQSSLAAIISEKHVLIFPGNSVFVPEISRYYLSAIRTVNSLADLYL